MAANVPGRTERIVSGRVPVMGETRYDLTSSLGIAAIILLVGTVLLLIAVWLSNFLPSNYTPPVEMLPGTFGFEDGNENDTLTVEAPADLSDDPSLSNDQQDTNMEKALENMLSVSATASSFSLPNPFDENNSGRMPGAAIGNGGKPLGVRGGGRGGAPRHQRWIVEFAERRSLNLYAQQLDFFGIELAAAFSDGRIFYVRKLSAGFETRQSSLKAGDERLYMNWQDGGDRVKADRELLTKAGIPDLDQAKILHFYPQETERLLIEAETSYANRPRERIRRTNFRVEGTEGDFRFVVKAQKYR